MAVLVAWGMDDGIGGRGREEGRRRAGSSRSTGLSLLLSPPLPTTMDAQKQLQTLSDEFQQLQTGNSGTASASFTIVISF